MRTKILKPNKSIACVGPLPPPVNGASNINSYFIDELRSRNERIVLIDTSRDQPIPTPLSSTNLSRLLTRLYCLLELIRNLGHIKSIYLTLCGGPGQFFDLIVVLLAFIAKKRLVCHHHSYGYVNKWSLPAAAISAFKDNVMHIFLGEQMQNKYFNKYSHVSSTCISNLAFMPSLTCNHKHFYRKDNLSKSLVIGHLSNLSYQKGSHHFIELARICDEQVPSWKFLLAGPIVDSKFRRDYLDDINRLDNLVYFGPLDSKAKAEFYRSIDIFILLSEYKHEAEPLVIFEAISNGAVPVATSVGEIPSLLTTLNLLTKGYCIPSEAFEIILFLAKSGKYHEIREELHDNLSLIQSKSLIAKNLVIHYLTTCTSKKS